MGHFLRLERLRRGAPISAHGAKPAVCLRKFRGCRRKKKTIRSSKIDSRKRLEGAAAGNEWLIEKRNSSRIHEQIECDKPSRVLFGQFANPPLRRMNSLQELIEIKVIADRHSDFAIKH